LLPRPKEGRQEGRKEGRQEGRKEGVPVKIDTVQSVCILYIYMYMYVHIKEGKKEAMQ
jgi:hypothetical protein